MYHFQILQTAFQMVTQNSMHSDGETANFIKLKSNHAFSVQNKTILLEQITIL